MPARRERPTVSGEPPTTVYGIDLGVGSDDAGRSTWIVELDASDPGAPHVTTCAPLAERLDCSPAREPALSALADFLAAQDATTAIGLDVPFGLPRRLLPESIDSWRASLGWFADECRDGQFTDPGAFSEWGTARAREITDGDRAYLPRRTDEAFGAQCVYGFIGRYPTFYGLRDLLVPLVHDPLTPRVTVAPVMTPDWIGDGSRSDDSSDEQRPDGPNDEQRPDEPNDEPRPNGPNDEQRPDESPTTRPRGDRPTILETYPAAIHETRAIHRESYKEATDEARDRREENRDALLANVDATITDPARERVAADTGGDALDALAAAVAAFANTRGPDGLGPADVPTADLIEARIYV